MVIRFSDTELDDLQILEDIFKEGEKTKTVEHLYAGSEDVIPEGSIASIDIHIKDLIITIKRKEELCQK